MKRMISPLLALALLAGGSHFNLRAAPSPGEVDFGKFSRPGAGVNYVEINVKQNLLSLAARLVEKAEPEAAKLLRSIQLVRVNVLGLTDDNRGDMEKRAQDVRSHLEKQNWERTVTVQDKDGQDVGVYVKARGDEALEGLVVIVLDGKKQEAVFINIVGDIKPEQLAALGEAMHIDPLKKAGAAVKK